jgi:hypothetical protein
MRRAGWGPELGSGSEHCGSERAVGPWQGHRVSAQSRRLLGPDGTGQPWPADAAARSAGCGHTTSRSQLTLDIVLRKEDSTKEEETERWLRDKPSKRCKLKECSMECRRCRFASRFCLFGVWTIRGPKLPQSCVPFVKATLFLDHVPSQYIYLTISDFRFHHCVPMAFRSACKILHVHVSVQLAFAAGKRSLNLGRTQSHHAYLRVLQQVYCHFLAQVAQHLSRAGQLKKYWVSFLSHTQQKPCSVGGFPTIVPPLFDPPLKPVMPVLCKVTVKKPLMVQSGTLFSNSSPSHLLW